MEIGISVFGSVDYGKHIEYLKKNNVSRSFVMADIPDFDEVMEKFSKNGIICEALHAPFDKINDMWGADKPRGEAMLKKLFSSADKCAKYAIPTMVVHLSSGKPMPTITEDGAVRFSRLMDYARERNVKIAYENQRFLENLEFAMARFPDAGFCWDCGHEYGFSHGIRFMPLFGKRLAALHIHDNLCGIDTDNHLIPFDGKIDFNVIAREIAESGYCGTLMLEITKDAVCEGRTVYADMPLDKYYKKAAEAARRLAAMADSFRK